MASTPDPSTQDAYATASPEDQGLDPVCTMEFLASCVLEGSDSQTG